jgi:ATP-binding cassette subfamily B multidrug efflux pump
MKSTPSLLYLWPYLKRYRGKLLAGSCMVVLTVAAGMLAPWVLKYVVDDLRAAFAPEKLPYYAAAIVGIALVEGFFRFLMRRILIGMSREIEYDLRNDFFAHLQRMSLSYLQGRSTGDLMSRSSSDLAAVRSVLGPGLMYSMNAAVTAVAATAILLRLNWKLTLLAYIPLVLASIAVKQLGGRIHDRFEEIQAQFARLTEKVQENIAGIRVIQAFAREEAEIRSFHGLNQEYVRRNIRLIRLWGIFYPLMSALIGLSSVALLWYGGRAVVRGTLTLGEFVAFLGYLSLLTWPTIAIGWVINIFQRGSASMERMLEILRVPPQIGDDTAPEMPESVRGAVEVRALSFRYDRSPRPVLQDVTFSLPAGETLAIVGRTGSGKSTLVNLIPRLFDPPPGTVFVDGVDVRRWPLGELRRRIGFVPQEAFLFSDTVFANLAFGLHEGAPAETVERAAETAHLAAEIAAFPRRYQTLVGERGITLSGGQKQRAAIARALALEPQILILDDSFSSVDTYTEERVLRNLLEATRGRTTILVSHRISTVKHARQILVLENGRVVERGDHASLMALGGVYADLYRKQLLEEELATA